MKKAKALSIVVILLLILAQTNVWTTTLSLPEESKPIIVFDEAHGQWHDSNKLSMFLEDLRASYEVVINKEEITWNTLKDAWLLIITNPTDPFSDSEVKAIKRFLRIGKALLIMGTYHKYINVDELNKLINGSGIKFTKTDVLDDTHYDYKPYYPLLGVWPDNPVANQIKAGIEKVKYSGCMLEISGEAIPVVQTYETARAEDIDGNIVAEGSLVVAAVASYLGGWVFAIGGADAFRSDRPYYYVMFDNKAFALNIIDWLYRATHRVALIDLAHGEYFVGSKIANLTSLMKEMGFTVIENTGALTESTLAGVDVLVLMAPESDSDLFTDEEIQAIQSFIKNGGVLFIGGPRGKYWRKSTHQLNNILAPFNISLIQSAIIDETNYDYEPTHPILYTWADNPVAQRLGYNVSQVYYDGCAVRIIGDGPIPILIGDDDTKAVHPEDNATAIVEGQAVLGVVVYDLPDGGRIFVTGSAAIFRTYKYKPNFESNYEFILNVLGWLKGEPPGKKPASLIASLQVQPTARLREVFIVSYEIKNIGGEDAENVTVELMVPYILNVTTPLIVNIGNIEPGKSVVVNWTLEALLEGSGDIIVRLTSDNAGSREDASTIEVLPDIEVESIVTPTVIKPGETQRISIKINISNEFTEPVTNVVVSVASSGLGINETKNIASIEAGGSVSITIEKDVTVPTQGIFEIEVSVTSADGGEVRKIYTVLAVTGKVILYDQGHAQYFNAKDMQGFISLLNTYAPVFINNATITKEVLDMALLVIIPNPNEGFSQDEVEALIEYVENGGALLIMGHWYRYFWPEYLDPITKPFGIEWYDANIIDMDDNINKKPYLPVLSNWADNELAATLSEGVESVVFDGTGLKISGDVVPILLGDTESGDNITKLTDENNVLILNGSDVIAAAAVTYNKGKIFAIGSTLAFVDSYQNYGFYQHNEKFIKNILAWLIGVKKLEVNTEVVAEIEEGETTTLTIRLDNTGSIDITGIVINIETDEYSEVVGDKIINVGTVQAYGSKTIQVNIKGKKAGTTNIKIVITSENYETIERTVSITIKAAPPAIPYELIAGAIIIVIVIVVALIMLKKKPKK